MTGLPRFPGFCSAKTGLNWIAGTQRESDVVGLPGDDPWAGRLIAVVGFSRAGSKIFWKAHQRLKACRGRAAASRHLKASVGTMVSVGRLAALACRADLAACPVTRV